MSQNSTQRKNFEGGKTRMQALKDRIDIAYETLRNIYDESKLEKISKNSSNVSKNPPQTKLIQYDLEEVANKRNKTSEINSYINDSFESRSFYSVHPNSMDNDILHQMKRKKKKEKKKKKWKKKHSRKICGINTNFCIKDIKRR